MDHTRCVEDRLRSKRFLMSQARESKTMVDGWRPVYVFGFCAICFLLPVSARPADPDSSGRRMIPAVTTAHTVWAKPYHAGKIRILAISPVWAARETLELAQRLDSDYVQVSIPFGRDENKQPAAFEFLKTKLLESYDVIITGGLRWTLFPEDIRVSILNKIRQGTGFVFVYPQGLDRELFTAFQDGRIAAPAADWIGTVPFQTMPVFSEFPSAEDCAKELVRQSVCGKGRIVFLAYQTGRSPDYGILYLTPGTAGKANQADYDHSFSLIIRTILWAGRKEPEMRISSLSLSGQPVSGRPSSLRAEIVAAPALIGRTEALVRVRDGKGNKESEKQVVWMLKEGGNSLSAEIVTPITPGKYFIDLVLTRNGATFDWRTLGADVIPAVSISLSLDKEFFEAGAPISGKISFPAGFTGEYEMTLRDGFDRIVSRETKSVAAGTTRVSFALSHPFPLTTAHKVGIRLFQGKQVIQEEKFPCLIRRKEPADRFTFAMFMLGAGGNEHTSKEALNILARDVVDTWEDYFQGNPVLTGAACEQNLAMIPYIYSLKSSTVNKALVRQPCFSDPAFRQRMEEDLIALARKMVQFSPVAYSLGDENEISHWAANKDVCFSPSCKADFVRYLRAEYPGLDLLNKEWDTSFSQWEDVTAVPLDVLIKRGEKTNFAPWVDHRLHMESVFADVHRFGRDVIRKVDKDARVGLDGIWAADNSFTGIDCWKLARDMQFICPYGDLVIWRSFCSPDTLLLPAGTFQHDPVFSRHWPWSLLYNGANGAEYYTVFGDPCAAVNPDFTLEESYQALAGEVREIKKGIDALILNAELDNEDVVIQYSPASVHLNTVFQKIGPAWFNLPPERSLMECLVKTLGFQPRYVSVQEIEEGQLLKKNRRLLVLPFSAAVSEKEAAAIAAFVASGGTVMADILPALADGHGKIRPFDRNPLNGVFGIRRKEWPATPEAGVKFFRNSCVWGFPVAENLLPDKGKVLAGSSSGRPAVIVNDYGKGRTICLNFLPNVKMTEGETRELNEFLSGFLASFTLKPPVFFMKGGKRVFNVETFLFRRDNLLYMGVLPPVAAEKRRQVKQVARRTGGVIAGVLDAVIDLQPLEEALLHIGGAEGQTVADVVEQETGALREQAPDEKGLERHIADLPIVLDGKEVEDIAVEDEQRVSAAIPPARQFERPAFQGQA